MRTVRICRSVLALTALLTLPSEATAQALAKVFRAGVYAIDITPERFPVIVNGMFMERTANAAHDRLFSRCLALDDGTTSGDFTSVGQRSNFTSPVLSWPIELELTEVTRLCRELAGGGAVRLPPAVTPDVGWIEGRGWAVVELNPVWSSGFYGCDAARVLPALRRVSGARV